ncbi:MAG TPA: TonB-dependent receptor plug domain-containing protein, partial [Polyangiaceae bacterium]|nr:TonB-dependent receptor plug domain-containing protein [Polyangiaceae bacterium]
DQIRFFLDGVPLDLMGYPSGVANVPVNLVQRVDVYRGVVPLRLGADALGGAVHLISDQDLREGPHVSSSLQAGSFDTYRLSLGAHHFAKPTGWFTRLSGFFDHADNDYPMKIDVAGADGSERPTTVRRFHDGYQAEGVSVESGIVDRPWARRLVARAFLAHYQKDIQHNLLMTFNPYGEVELEELSFGGNVRYDNVFLHRLQLQSVVGYMYRGTGYEDLGNCKYKWSGACEPTPQPGERTGRPQDQDYFEHNLYARLNTTWYLGAGQMLRALLAPTFTGRSGTEHRLPNPETRDPLSAQRDLYGLVSGIEHEADLFDGNLENVVFVKDYLQVLRSEAPLSQGGGFVREDRTTHRVGAGDALRYSLTEWLIAKASYEWATRLPRADEIFGNAFPIEANLELEPELSHNVNLSLALSALTTSVGALRGELNGFLRDADQLIVLVGDNQSASYQNVYSARSLGGEGSLGWTSLGDYVSLDANATYVDFRNTSDAGAFAEYKGSRIPNRPYLFANGSARLQRRNLITADDQGSLDWTTRYVHGFYRAWDDLGTDKIEVPAQLLHSLALTYLITSNALVSTFTLEAQNLTNARAYDFLGVPKPGRSFNFKATLSL